MIMKIKTRKYGIIELEKLPSPFLKWVAENWRDDTVATEADQLWAERELDGDHFYEDDYDDYDKGDES